jgi:hypothetical protein
MNTNLYELLGGTPGDIIIAVEQMLAAIDLDGHSEGASTIILICRHLLQIAAQERR